MEVGSPCDLVQCETNKELAGMLRVDASHVSPILPTNVEQRIRDLTEARDLHGLHQFLEHVPTLACDLLQLSEGRLRGLAFHRLPVGDPLQTGFLPVSYTHLTLPTILLV